MVDEFLLRVGNWANGGFDTPRKNHAGLLNHRVVFHPHCHQRAEGLADDGLPSGTSATVEMLKLAGFDVDLIDGGCCGMAGTFGYDAEHYELSMQVGELGVLPKIRAQRLEIGELVVASTGSACRIQIKHGTGIEAKHPLELVRDAMLANSSKT